MSTFYTSSDNHDVLSEGLFSGVFSNAPKFQVLFYILPILNVSRNCLSRGGQW